MLGRNDIQDLFTDTAFFAATRGDLPLLQVLLGPSSLPERTRFLALRTELYQIKTAQHLQEFIFDFTTLALNKIAAFLALDARYQAVGVHILKEDLFGLADEGIQASVNAIVTAGDHLDMMALLDIKPGMQAWRENYSLNSDNEEPVLERFKQTWVERFQWEIAKLNLDHLDVLDDVHAKAKAMNGDLPHIQAELEKIKQKSVDLMNERDELVKKYHERIDWQLGLLADYKENPARLSFGALKLCLDSITRQLQEAKEGVYPLYPQSASIWVSPELVDPKKNTLIHHAVAEKNYHVVHYLVSMGVPLQAKNANGQTAAQLCYLTEDELESRVSQYKGDGESKLIKSFLLLLEKYKMKSDEILMSPIKRFFYALFRDIKKLQALLERDIPAYLKLIETVRKEASDKRLVIEGIPIAMTAKTGNSSLDSLHSEALVLFRRYHEEEGFGRRQMPNQTYDDVAIVPGFLPGPGGEEKSSAIVEKPASRQVINATLRLINRELVSRLRDTTDALEAQGIEMVSLKEQLATSVNALAAKEIEVATLEEKLAKNEIKTAKLESNVEELMAFMIAKKSKKQKKEQQAIPDKQPSRSTSPEAGSVSNSGLFRFSPPPSGMTPPARHKRRSSF